MGEGSWAGRKAGAHERLPAPCNLSTHHRNTRRMQSRAHPPQTHTHTPTRLPPPAAVDVDARPRLGEFQIPRQLRLGVKLIKLS